jgi:hypothetical protein
MSDPSPSPLLRRPSLRDGLLKLRERLFDLNESWKASTSLSLQAEAAPETRALMRQLDALLADASPVRSTAVRWEKLTDKWRKEAAIIPGNDYDRGYIDAKQHCATDLTIEGLRSESAPVRTEQEKEKDSARPPSGVSDEQATAGTNREVRACARCGEPATRKFYYPGEPWEPYCSFCEPQYMAGGPEPL